MRQNARWFMAAVLLSPTLAVAANKESALLNGVVDGETYLTPSMAFALNLADEKMASTILDENTDHGLNVSFEDKDGNKFSIMIVPTEQNEPNSFVDGIIQRSSWEGQESEKSVTPDADPCLIQRKLLKEDGADAGFGRMNVIFLRNKTIFDIVMDTKGFKKTSDASDALASGFVSFWEKADFRGQYVSHPLLNDPVDPLVAKALDAAKEVASEKGCVFKVESRKKVIARFLFEGNAEIEVALGLKRRGPGVVFTRAFFCRGDDFKAGERKKEEVAIAFVKRLEKGNIPFIGDGSFDADIFPEAAELHEKAGKR